MDKIIIEDLEVYAYHGAAAEEKVLGQMFLISVEITTDLGAAAESDDLSKTIHYGHVCDLIKQLFLSQKYDLIEAAVLAVIEGILDKYEAAVNVKVMIKKPWAPLGHHLKYVAVRMERGREVKDDV